jgi:hypothetical protein
MQAEQEYEQPATKVAADDAADKIEWNAEEHPLPAAKRPSSNMRRCDGVSGIE